MNHIKTLKPTPIPVTILTGFLGSGKTTLLKHLLLKSQQRIAIIENELGPLPIDDSLILENTPVQEIEMVGGRTCCEARQDLLEKLLLRTRRPMNYDYLVMETTGVAHPGMVAQSFLGHETINSYFRLDGIVCIVDAAHFDKHLGGEGHLSEQIACADVILINKIDLVSAIKSQEIRSILAQINGHATIYETQEARIEPHKILNTGAFDLSLAPHMMSGCGKGHSHQSHGHQHEIKTVSLKLDEELDMKQFDTWINQLLQNHYLDIYRSKGLIFFDGIERPLIFQGVHDSIRAELASRNIKKGERQTQLVFIGRNLDIQKLEEGLRACIAEINV